MYDSGSQDREPVFFLKLRHVYFVFVMVCSGADKNYRYLLKVNYD
jgi:hypothetical protein